MRIRSETCQITGLHYNLVRSRRRTLSLLVREDGSIEIRCPLHCSKAQIDQFINDKSDWIIRKRRENRDIIKVSAPAHDQKAAAADLLKQRCEKVIIGHALRRPTALAIRDQRSRWGSCSSRGRVALNIRCIHLPEHLQDYVILHELCHLHHMNHGPDFWRLLESYLPDARQRRRALNRYRLAQEEKT